MGAPAPRSPGAPALPQSHMQRAGFPTAAVAPAVLSGEKAQGPQSTSGEHGASGPPTRPLQRCSALRPGWVSPQGWPHCPPALGQQRPLRPGQQRRCRAWRLTAHRKGSEAAQPATWEENSSVAEGGQGPLVRITPQSLTVMQVKRGQHTRTQKFWWRLMEKAAASQKPDPLETQ